MTEQESQCNPIEHSALHTMTIFYGKILKFRRIYCYDQKESISDMTALSRINRMQPLGYMWMLSKYPEFHGLCLDDQRLLLDEFAVQASILECARMTADRRGVENRRFYHIDGTYICLDRAHVARFLRTCRQQPSRLEIRNFLTFLKRQVDEVARPLEFESVDEETFVAMLLLVLWNKSLLAKLRDPAYVVENRRHIVQELAEHLKERQRNTETIGATLQLLDSIQNLADEWRNMKTVSAQELKKTVIACTE